MDRPTKLVRYNNPGKSYFKEAYMRAYGRRPIPEGIQGKSASMCIVDEYEGFAYRPLITEGLVLRLLPGTVYLGGFMQLHSEERGEFTTCCGIDGGGLCDTPALQSIGIELDFHNIDFSQPSQGHPATDGLPVFGEGWWHVIRADGAEPVIVAFCWPEHGNCKFLHVVVLSLGVGDVSRSVAEAGGASSLSGGCEGGDQ